MPDQVWLVAAAVVFLVVCTGAALWFLAKIRVHAKQGVALVVSTRDAKKVHFGPAFVMPGLHSVESIDVTMQTMKIVCEGAQGIRCEDNIRADIEAVFTLGISPRAADVLKVAEAVGCARATDPEALRELFAAKFSDGLASVAAGLSFEELQAKRALFVEAVLETIGFDLSGYHLSDLAIERLAQTPIAKLDPDNMLDAEAILRITERTSAAKVKAAQVHLDASKRVASLEAEAREAYVEVQRRQLDALANLRAETGKNVTPEQLEGRLMEKLQALVGVVVEKRLNGN